MIRFKALQLNNFRCFENFEIRFHPELTVLVARNGQGKSALLDAIALAIGLFVDGVSGIPQERRIEWRDVRRVRHVEKGMVSAGTVAFQATGIIDGIDIKWGRNRRGDSPNGKTSRKDAKPLTAIAENLRSRITAQATVPSQQVDLPLVAYYGTGRGWDHSSNNTKWPHVMPTYERCLGYFNCLNGTAGYNLLVEWYRRTFESLSEKIDTPKGRLIQNPVTGHVNVSRPELLLSAVNQAVNCVLKKETGWHGLYWDKKDGLVLEHSEHGTLPMAFLSDGIRNTAALVADVAHRCARLNPHLEDAAKKTMGVLLIDEIDLHLHPEWQQLILNALRSTFPKLQIIISTHSPQVVSTVSTESIRIVDRDHLSPAPAGTNGAEAQRILEDVFNVPARPNTEMANALKEYLQLVDQRNWDTKHARELRRLLDDWSKGEEPALFQADLQIENMKWEAADEGNTQG